MKRSFAFMMKTAEELSARIGDSQEVSGCYGGGAMWTPAPARTLPLSPLSPSSLPLRVCVLPVCTHMLCLRW